MSAIVRADGDALVMHVGERPYVVVGTQTINISTHGLNLNQMVGMLGQLVPADSQGQLEEFGAVECKIPFTGSDDRFSVVAARGGDDVWIEIRRRRAPAPVIVAPEPPPVPAAAAAVVAPAPEQETPKVEVPQPVEAAPAVEAAAVPVEPAVVDHQPMDQPAPSIDSVPVTEAAAPATILEPEAPSVEAPVTTPEVAQPAIAEASPAEPAAEPIESVEVRAETQLAQPAPESSTQSVPEAIIEEPAIVAQPATVDEPETVDEPATVEQPSIAETPAIAASADEPARTHVKPAIETPSTSLEPAIAEADQTVMTSLVSEEPVSAYAEPNVVADAPQFVEAAQMTAPAPIAEPEPVVEVTAVTVPEPLAEVAAVEPAAIAEPEQVTEVATLSEPEPAAEVAAVAEPAPVAEAAAVAEPEPVMEAATIAEPEPVVQAAAIAQSEPVVEPERVDEPAVETIAASHCDAIAGEPSVEPAAIVERESAPSIESAEEQLESAPDVEPITASEPSTEPEPVSITAELAEPVSTAAELAEPVAAAAEVAEPDEVAAPEQIDEPAPIAASTEREVAQPVVPEFIEAAASAAEAATAPAAPDVPDTLASEENEEEVVEPAATHTPEAPTPAAPDTIAASAHSVPDVDEDLAEPDDVMPLTRTVRIEVPPRVIPPPRPAPPPISPRASLDVERLLRAAASRGASAVFLSSDSRPWIRLEGDVRQLETEPSLSRADVERVMLELAPESGHESIGRGETTEWILEVSDVGRVRCTTFVDHRGPGILLRLIATRAATAEQLGLSREIQGLATESEGLVLVAGPRGSGKSTVMSALVDLVNRQRTDLVISLERQIRLVHDNKSALISQREIRGNAEDALAAARSALRENPDVLVVDDLLSPQMIPLLMDAAADGHLVMVSITAPSTTDAIGRLIELTPPPMRAAVRDQLAESFRGAVSQVLLKKSGGGLVAARELMLATAPVMRVIGEGQFGQLPLAFDSGRKYGMTSLNDALVDLVRSGHVDVRDAFRKAADRDRLVERLKREGIDTSSVERLA